MAQEVTNFARFYATFNKISYSGDREDLKKEMVGEYQDLCEGLEKIYPANRINEAAREELRRQRSICLRLMQRLGVNTLDWNRINAFCQDGRIAGKQFRDITTEELKLLACKLRSIERKGGIRELEEPGPKAIVVPFK